MASKLILLPLIEHLPPPNRKDEPASYEPDFLGFAAPDDFDIRTNYRDVGKVTVTGSDKYLTDLAAKSKAHFAEAWGGR